MVESNEINQKNQEVYIKNIEDRLVEYEIENIKLKDKQINYLERIRDLTSELNKQEETMNVYEKENNVTLSKDFAVYHKDGNIENNTKENLDVVLKKDMAKIFNPQSHNQYTKSVIK